MGGSLNIVFGFELAKKEKYEYLWCIGDDEPIFENALDIISKNLNERDFCFLVGSKIQNGSFNIMQGYKKINQITGATPSFITATIYNCSYFTINDVNLAKEFEFSQYPHLIIYHQIILRNKEILITLVQLDQLCDESKRIYGSKTKGRNNFGKRDSMVFFGKPLALLAIQDKNYQRNELQAWWKKNWHLVSTFKNSADFRSLLLWSQSKQYPSLIFWLILSRLPMNLFKNVIDVLISSRYIYTKRKDVGSTFWRLKNYGFFASLRYQIGKFKFHSTHKKGLPELSLSQFIGLLSASSKPDDFFRVTIEIEDLLCKLKPNLTSGIMKLNANQNFSKNLPTVLALCIMAEKPEVVIETGTQNGLSTSIILESINRYSPGTKFLSFDVTQNPLLDSRVEPFLFILGQPSRKNFKKISLENAEHKTLFCHDSDHSYENMIFEYNRLKCDILVSDDVEENSAFEDFCIHNKLFGFKIKLDFGPAVGIIMRKNQL
jgi:hypothetical protein